MIELLDNELIFSFPEVHPSARLSIQFQRTLRIPDDNKEYPLPPGLGSFPLKHVDDYQNTIPKAWKNHGGVMLPMYQSEALWINFNSSYIQERDAYYPFVVKIATGKIDALTGKAWKKGLSKRPQNYIVTPHQPWIDGYCVSKGVIRQFVAMPLGKGFTAEEQITKKSEYGGLQIQVYPMKADIFKKKFPIKEHDKLQRFILSNLINKSNALSYDECCVVKERDFELGLAPGGKMMQEIYDDPYKLTDWDRTHTSRCFVHIANSDLWNDITNEHAPTIPPTAKEYSVAGLPWFDYYADNPDIKPLKGSKKLSSLKTIKELGEIKGESPLPENDTVASIKVIRLKGKSKRKVRRVKMWTVQQVAQFREAIDSYNFPAVYFDFGNNIEVVGETMQDVEIIINSQLRSPHAEVVKNGLANILYWGYAKIGYREHRIRRFNRKITLSQINSFQNSLRDENMPSLIQLKNIHMPEYSGMSFVSKILMFLNPQNYCVLDQQLSKLRTPNSPKLLNNLKFDQNDTQIKINTDNQDVYNCWRNECLAISQQYYEGNYRVVDIERGFFNLIQQGNLLAARILYNDA